MRPDVAHKNDTESDLPHSWNTAKNWINALRWNYYNNTIIIVTHLGTQVCLLMLYLDGMYFLSLELILYKYAAWLINVTRVFKVFITGPRRLTNTGSFFVYV